MSDSYKGYTISGSADRVFGYDKKWYAAARVTLMCPDNVRIEVEHFHDPLLTHRRKRTGSHLTTKQAFLRAVDFLLQLLRKGEKNTCSFRITGGSGPADNLW